MADADDNQSSISPDLLCGSSSCEGDDYTINAGKVCYIVQCGNLVSLIKYVNNYYNKLFSSSI